MDFHDAPANSPSGGSSAVTDKLEAIPPQGKRAAKPITTKRNNQRWSVPGKLGIEALV
jgi:hypothetical protein